MTTIERPTTRRSDASVRFDRDGIYDALLELGSPCHVLRVDERIGLANREPRAGERELFRLDPLPAQALGNARFRAAHGVRYAYHGGAMAGGIASEDMVAALAREGFLASFGAAGLPAGRVDRALARLRAELGEQPFACNLIHSPSDPADEEHTVDACLRHRVRCVEASAYLALTPALVRYRASGLDQNTDGSVHIGHTVIAKVSRTEVAAAFLAPAPEPMLADLVAAGRITQRQADLARRVPMADDITVEADSGGHTDNQSLSALLPLIIRQRDEAGFGSVRIGAAGGLGTPEAVAAAYSLGADYVVTGSVNQACREAGTSDQVKALLAEATLTDCQMAPAADMFEMGVRLQVLKKGTLFPMRAGRLYELFRSYSTLDDIPAADMAKLEKQVFRQSVAQVWSECVEHYRQSDPSRLEGIEDQPRRKMGMVFRWYLAMGSRWASAGEPDRRADYQIWCGPAMGSFNDWARGSYLAAPGNRRVAEVALHLMRGAGFATRAAQLRLAGIRLPASCTSYRPEPLNEPSRQAVAA